MDGLRTRPDDRGARADALRQAPGPRLLPSADPAPRGVLRVAVPRLLAAWLLDTPGCPAAARRALSAGVFVAFLVLVVLGTVHHQVWRDEMRALSLALEPVHWHGIFATLQNEGHPALWHLLLRGAHTLYESPLVLRVVTLVIGLCAAGLVFFRAPLPTWWRATFLFGWVPLFECPVLCRNYGIGVLLAFVFCRLVRPARVRPLLAASTLALLANTSVYGTMLAGGLSLFLVVQLHRRGTRPVVIVTAVLLVAAGTALAAWTMAPTSVSKLLRPAPDSAMDLVLGVGRAVVGFSTTTNALFGVALLAWPIVAAAVLATAVLPHLALGVLAVFAAAAWFGKGVYPCGPQHLGMLYAFLVAATWLRVDHAPVAAPVWSQRAWRVFLFVVWPWLLLAQAYRGVREIHMEVEYAKTSAPELARVLERGDLAGAIVIGEPDYYLDALPYYRDNPIWVPREGHFARRVSWTTANRQHYDLGALLATARRLRAEHRAPVVLVVGQQMRLDLPSGDVVHGYGDRFTWTPAQQAEFATATERIASLPARPSRFRGDERYDVYRLRE